MGGGQQTLEIDSDQTSTNLITNEGTNTLFTKLQHLFDTYASIDSKLDLWVISGFFNAQALQAIATSFAPKLNSLHIIIGKTTPSQSDTQSIAFAFCDPFDLEIKDFAKQLELLTTYQEALEFITDTTCDVKVYALKDRNVLIHSKLYLLHQHANKAHKSFAIIGSSNLTASGLGIYGGDKANIELNLLCDSHQDTEYALRYFTTLRDQCTDVSAEVADNLKSSFLYHSPCDVLSKLIALFPSDTPLQQSEQDRLSLAQEVFGLYDFQLVAAKELYKRLKAYHIAFLGDPVGAGKTLSALGVISLYKRPVIITPKNLKAQWESYFKRLLDSIDSQTQREFLDNLSFSIKIFSYYEASQEDNRSLIQSADLIVLDESHTFRNGAPKANRANNYTRLRANISKDCDFLALSATIINNSLLDFANQIGLFTDTITLHNTPINPHEICRYAQKQLIEQKPLPQEYYYLTSLIFSRSSAEIASELRNLSKDLPTPDIKTQHLSSIPKHIDFSYQKLLEILGIDTDENAQTQSLGISFSIYDPYKFLPPHIAQQIKESHLENLGEYTTPRGFITMSLLKSLESSVDAFLQTLEKIIAYHDYFLDSLSIERENDQQENDEIDSTLLPTRLKNLVDLDLLGSLDSRFMHTLKEDVEKLNQIKSLFVSYNSDTDFAKSPKFQALSDFIKSHQAHITEEKLLIFTESIPTARAICQSLQHAYPHLRVAYITGDTKSKEFATLTGQFAPRAQGYTLGDERAIDILVATDVLSEGQNLQDCANLINWDIAFNPVRSIQRTGRIHRIGSPHDKISIAHFFPDIEIDSYINLEQRLKFKLIASQSTTHTHNPFSIDQKAQEEHFQRYRQMLTKDLIAFEENTTLFNSPQKLLQSLSYEVGEGSRASDGIFSIIQIPRLECNTIFAALQDIQSKDLYFTLYDRTLHPSATHPSGEHNLAKLLPYIKDTSIPTDAFRELERISATYRDIGFLKDRFLSLTNALDEQIRTITKERESHKKSDGGLIPTARKRFRLIAWLLINPDFATLSPAYTTTGEDK